MWLIQREAILAPRFWYDTGMEGSPNKETLKQEAEIKPLTPEQEADLRAALVSIDSPHTQKKSPEESQVRE